MDNRERARARDKQQRRPISFEENHKNFIAVVRKRGNVSGHHGENERQRRKSEREHIKHVTKKFLEFFSFSRAKQWQKNVQKKGWCTCKVGFMLIRPTDVFGYLRCRRLLQLHDFIFHLSKL